MYEREEGLPIYSFPLYSRKLRDTKICVSQIDLNEKSKLFKLIEMMEGCGYEKLTNSVKVLLTRSVDSQKYHVAHLNKIHVLFPDWIYENWKLSNQSVDYNPFDEDYLRKFKIPIFYKLKICLSGYPMEEKLSFRKIIENNGGVYYSELKNNEVTHLVTETSSSEKFVFAKQWKIKVVCGNWLTDSLKQGFCAEFLNYEIQENKLFADCVILFNGCSEEFINKWTSLIELNSGKIISDFEIEGEKESPTHVVVESLDNLNLKSQFNYVTKSWLEKSFEIGKILPVDEFKLDLDLIYDWDDEDDGDNNSLFAKGGGGSNAVDTNTEFSSSIDITTEQPLPIFTDCSILFHGCSEQFVDKWKRIIEDNHGEIITGIPGEIDEKIFIIVDKMENLVRRDRLKYVNRIWLEQCWEKKRLLPTDDFLIEWDIDLFDFQEIDSNLFVGCRISFHGCSREFIDKWRSIITNHSGTVVVVGSETDSCSDSQHTSPTHTLAVVVVDDDSKLSTLSQYNYVTKSWLEQSFEQNRILPITDFLVGDDCFDELSGIDLNELDSSIGDRQTNSETRKETIIIDTNSNNSRLFSSVSFFIDETVSCYSSGRLVKSITQNGGQILTENAANCNYIVADILLNHQLKCGRQTRIITEYYVRQCVTNQRIFERTDHFLFSPIVVRDVNSIRTILSECVISFSGFESIENEELTVFAQRFGANVQEIIMEKECTNKKLKANSCVIASNKDSNGLRTAIKLNIPVVSKEWLHSCAIHKRKQNFKEFLIDFKKIAPSTSAVRSADVKIIQNNDEMNNLTSTFQTVITRSLKRKNSESTSMELETVKATERKSVAHLSDQELHDREVGWNYEISNDAIESDCHTIKTEVVEGNIKRPRHASVSASPIVINEQKKKAVRGRTQRKEIKTEAKEIKTQLKKNDYIDKENKPEAKEENIVVREQNSMKVFAFKGLTEEEILKSSSVIHNLGGQFIHESFLSSEVTHLISKNMDRDSKLMTAMASGMWVLHYSYISASARESRWLEEERYEWGVHGTTGFFSKNPQVRDVQVKLSSAARKWRKIGGKAFDKWRIVLIENSGKLERFKQLFSLGGAEILPITNSFPSQFEFTHAFLNPKCMDYTGLQLPLDYKWINIKYIFSHLMDGIKDPPTIKPAFLCSKQEIVNFNKSIFQKSRAKNN